MFPACSSHAVAGMSLFDMIVLGDSHKSSWYTRTQLLELISRSKFHGPRVHPPSLVWECKIEIIYSVAIKFMFPKNSGPWCPDPGCPGPRCPDPGCWSPGCPYFQTIYPISQVFQRGTWGNSKWLYSLMTHSTSGNSCPHHPSHFAACSINLWSMKFSGNSRFSSTKCMIMRCIIILSHVISLLFVWSFHLITLINNALSISSLVLIRTLRDCFITCSWPPSPSSESLFTPLDCYCLSCQCCLPWNAGMLEWWNAE